MRTRYLLWSLEKFRAGDNPKDFAHEARGKKKIRGYVVLLACASGYGS